MKHSEIKKILAAYTDFPAEKRGTSLLWQQVPEEVIPLLELIDLLHEALQPVETPAEFRQKMAAQLRAETNGSHTSSLRPTPRMWIGAAAVGSVLSLAGLFLWRRRQRTQPLVFPSPA